MAGVQVLQPEKKKDPLSEGALEIGKDMIASKIKGGISDAMKSPTAEESTPLSRRMARGGYGSNG